MSPKNPTIAKFFIQLGRVDELGSGVLNVNRYLDHYAPGKKPVFQEGAAFKSIIPLDEAFVTANGLTVTANALKDTVKVITDTVTDGRNGSKKTCSGQAGKDHTAYSSSTGITVFGDCH